MKVSLTTRKKEKPDFSKLGFGKYFTDHMLVMTYSDGKWNEPEIGTGKQLEDGDSFRNRCPKASKSWSL